MSQSSDVDVVIIGAGASAGVAAVALVEAGLTVTCLEQGGWPDRSTFGGDTPAGELIGLKRWSSSPAVRGDVDDYPIDATASQMAPLNYNGVGGGSVLYNGQWPRLSPRDFDVHTRDGVGADWPLTYAELQPYYEATDRQFGVSGLGGNPFYPDGAEPPCPPLPIGPGGLAVARAQAGLGWHWWPDSNAILSVPQGGRRACVQRGTCGRGCDEGAKASTDLTHWPRFSQLGGRLITGAVVRRIVVDSTDRATGVEWVDRDGKEHFQDAAVVLCAANGIGTPRLLLASADGRHPDGLANGSGLLGRNLMLHPMARVEGLLDEGPPWQGHNGGLINSMEFYPTDTSRGFVRGARWALVAGGAPLATSMSRWVRWGEQHHADMRTQLGHRVAWILLAEDLPDHDNLVSLAAEVDRAGGPGASVSYTIGDNTRHMLEWHAERATESLTAAGIRDVGVTMLHANGHFMGTARMGSDPDTSVCDRWGFTHQIPNLGIIDGSVFPTAGGMNPTSTISALALRTAHRLIEQRGPISRPAAGSTPTGSSTHPEPSPTLQLGATVGAPASIDIENRGRLRVIADLLIPGASGMPSASEAGVSDRLLDQLLDVRPDLAPSLVTALSEVTDDELTAPEILANRSQPMRTIGLVVAGAYYLSTTVRRQLGWDSEAGHPLEIGAYPPYVAEGLLDHMLAT